MKKTAHFIDFDDSFSYNIVQELLEVGFEVAVENWKDFEELPTADLLVLGPGPGVPDDYQRLYPLFQEWLDLKRPFFGVCLGHQIFWGLQGEVVYRSKEPLHGQRVSLELDDDWQKFLKLSSPIKVQRYNSLSVPAQVQTRYPQLKVLEADGEIMMTRGEGVLTYQFHPESVGTSFRQAFFKPLFENLV